MYVGKYSLILTLNWKVIEGQTDGLNGSVGSDQNKLLVLITLPASTAEHTLLSNSGLPYTTARDPLSFPYI